MRLAIGLLATLIGSGAALAQDRYPARTVQVIVPFAAGGNTDQMARPFFEALGKQLNGTFVIDNRGGAGGTIGTAQIAAAPADGYTLGFSPTSPLTNAPHLMKKLSFGFDDFEFVCQVFENIFTIAVAPNSRFKSLAELVDAARTEPGKLTYGTSGVASLPHLTGEGFAQKAGISLTHVPFRGDGQVVPAVLGNQIDFSISGMGSATSSLRVLAVFAGQRNAALPDAPTATELGFPSMPPGFQGVYARKGTPVEALNTLERGCREVVNSEAYQALGRRVNQAVSFLDRAEFSRRAREDYEFKGKLIRDLNLAQP